MSPDERQLLSELFARVQSASANRRDPEAEAFIAENVRAQPYAPYLLAQAVIVQEEALKNAAEKIETLERELSVAKAQAQGQGAQGQGAPGQGAPGQGASGGFLGSIFGGANAPQPAPQPAASTGPWGYQRSSVPQAGAPRYEPPPQQAAPWGGQQAQPPQGGSFLKGALGAAAGVAGGMLLANSLQGLFGGHNNTHGIASGENAGAGAGGGGTASSLASHDDSAIAGGIFDSHPKSEPPAAPAPAPAPASFDDGGGWDSGGDESYDT